MNAAAAPPVILWLRQDLRLADNPALVAAVETGRPVIPIYVLDETDRWPLGAASRWWLHHSLVSLQRALAACAATSGRPDATRSHLILRRGRAADILQQLAAETNAAGVFWNRCYEPHAVARDRLIKEKFQRSGLDVRSFNASLLFEPWQVQTLAGGPFRVFTAFWKASQKLKIDPPLPAPRVTLAARVPAGDDLADWGLLPQPDWAGGLRALWTPGEAGAQAQLQSFVERGVSGYQHDRDYPSRSGTSRLSPHLHFGEISPRQVRQAVDIQARSDGSERDAHAYVRELAWRDFAYHLLFHFPTVPELPLRPEFSDFPWHDDAAALVAWQRGKTGYPIVDAGMRELWATGWMHNRVRMIVASFLVKDLLLPWQAGAAWFWDTLVDADLANNSASWQWVAGCGVDAAPYFRIFNPIVQGGRFDPDGEYIRRWVPELARLPNSTIHAPWKASAAILAEGGIVLGQDYPRPIVDHGMARERALAAFAALRR